MAIYSELDNSTIFYTEVFYLALAGVCQKRRVVGQALPLWERAPSSFASK